MRFLCTIDIDFEPVAIFATPVGTRLLYAARTGRADTALTDILQGRHLGRGSEEEITVYSPVGLPMQDCVTAWHAYRRARQAGLGVEIAFDTDDEPEGPGQASPTP